ncbi:MAG: VWA domain-containing protein [Saprospiraceae bacterium]|jgi:Ca-activated chloride channel family protein|nr:VWA domain-containing protein [Saprospiraceae bacterium]MBP6566951.1 VWA domain-containing protein [Saprospiraceae bacterium]
MFRFEDTSAFYLLALIPGVVLLFLWMNRKRKHDIRAFGEVNLVGRLLRGKIPSFLKIVLFSIAVLFLILSALNPQWGLKKEKVKVEKSDIFFALDISASMNAQDISPSRLEKSKRFIEQLINERKGDQLGLILFAGGAYLQMPLTADYAAAQLFVRSASSEMAGTQGTAIGESIDLAMRSIKEKNQRALIILSDGEDHDEEAVNMAGKAAENGWNVFTIGVGSAEGSFVPVMNDGREEYKMDEEGNPVKSVLNQNLLKEIAENGKGSYYLLGNENTDIITDLNTQLDKMQKRAVEVKSFTEYRSFYQYFLGIGIIILLIEFFLVTKLKKV